MSIRIALVPLLFVVFSIANQADAQSLNGTWSVTTGTMSCKSVPSSALSSMSLKINGSTFEAKSGGLVSNGAIGANTLASPPQMEFTINSGADKGRKVKAIYELANNQLKIAFSESGQYPSSMSEGMVLSYRLSGAAAAPAVATGGAAARNPSGAARPNSPRPPKRSGRNLSPSTR